MSRKHYLLAILSLIILASCSRNQYKKYENTELLEYLVKKSNIIIRADRYQEFTKEIGDDGTEIWCGDFHFNTHEVLLGEKVNFISNPGKFEGIRGQRYGYDKVWFIKVDPSNGRLVYLMKNNISNLDSIYVQHIRYIIEKIHGP